jgi:phage terminase small subunit
MEGVPQTGHIGGTVARTGRPRLPVEQKRRTGRTPSTDSGGRKLPEPAVLLPAVRTDLSNVPVIPPDLLEDGERMWLDTWSYAAPWLTPKLDSPLVAQAARLYDEILELRGDVLQRGRLLREPIVTPTGEVVRDDEGDLVFKTTPNPAVKMLRDAEKEFRATLIDLAIPPAARARLGLAQVKAESALERLLAKRAERSG